MEVAHRKQQEAEATFHTPEGQCAALEEKTHQVCQDVPIVLVTSVPTERLEELAAVLKALHTEV